MLISAGRRYKISKWVTNVPSGSSVSFGRDQGTHGSLCIRQKKVWDDMAGRREGQLHRGVSDHVLQRVKFSGRKLGRWGEGGWGLQGPTYVQTMVSSRQEPGFLAEIEMFASLQVAMLSPGLLQGRSCISHMWVIQSSPALGLNKESKREPGLLEEGNDLILVKTYYA